MPTHGLQVFAHCFGIRSGTEASHVDGCHVGFATTSTAPAVLASAAVDMENLFGLDRDFYSSLHGSVSLCAAEQMVINCWPIWSAVSPHAAHPVRKGVSKSSRAAQ